MAKHHLDKVDSKAHVKRAYVRKVRGCYECSQRRISCDRSEPQCAKCLAKGIDCSGLGVRYRFNDGIATRGKKMGKTAHVAYGVSTRFNDPALPSESSSGGLVVNSSAALGSVGSTIHRTWNEKRKKQAEISLLSSPPEIITPSQRQLLIHFSRSIAKEMVAIDNQYNGWRYLLLPIAHIDATVMNAVLAVSAFHLSLNSSTLVKIPSSLFYTKALNGLHRRRQLLEYDKTTQNYILLAILVLLVAVMVNAGSDFPVLFRLLESGFHTISNADGLGQGELPEFLLRQINKLRVYAAPLMNEQAGVGIISSQAPQSFDCLRYTGSFHPEHSLAVSLIANLNQQAYQIYLHSVSAAAFSISSFAMVDRFKRTLETFPPDSPGEHVLIWATFMAAAVSSTPEHRDFFRAALKKHHERNGFENLAQALVILDDIWARGLAERWTAEFTKEPILIM